MAFAGVFVLAGAGWALLAGAFLVLAAWRKEPDWRSLASRAAGGGERLGPRGEAGPRRGTGGWGGGGGGAGAPRAGGGGAGGRGGGARGGGGAWAAAWRSSRPGWACPRVPGWRWPRAGCC